MLKQPRQPRHGKPAAGPAVGKQQLSPLQQQVLAAARHTCDHFGDTPAAREQMRREVLATPAALLPNLLRAFAAYQPKPPPREPPERKTHCGCLMHRTHHQDQSDDF